MKPHDNVLRYKRKCKQGWYHDESSDALLFHVSCHFEVIAQIIPSICSVYTRCLHVFFLCYRDEVLDQNPELMAEYLAEVERMKAAELAEQERLLRQIEQLEGELAAATDTPSSDASVGSAFGVQKVAASQDTDGTVNNMTKDEATLSELIETPAAETITSSPNDEEIENTSDVDQGSFIDDDSTTKQIAETSSQQLPPAIQAVLDKYVPPNVQILIRNFWIKIQQDVKQLVKLQIRLVKAFIGHVAQRIEERKAATTAKEATAELES